MKIDTLLHQEIEKELGELSRIELGTETYESTVNGVTKLLDRAIEIQKFDMEYAEKIKNREADICLKQQQMEDEKKDRVAKNILTAFGVVIPTVVTIWGTVKTLKFEEEGTVTTIMGRGFINKLLPKK